MVHELDSVRGTQRFFEGALPLVEWNVQQATAIEVQEIEGVIDDGVLPLQPEPLDSNFGAVLHQVEVWHPLLTKATAIQYANDGIRCNSIHPGPMMTPMTEFTRSDPERYELSVARIPMGRFGEPEEVAYGALYLASDESSYVTGSELVIDGGVTAQ